ncbi:MAG: MmgE/PrpD family protein [Candidatus Dormibacteraeota bacterium]|uniref:MmgE/PrpD family protein n=1 Tax=Candidatus Amunia macphersoniae TaxID=3127014 RepID=A0A934NFJ7_9BACT|nr:MmgE/PrpD family protein [Candidatus Dormibacteraeota bacterium]
MSSAVTTSGDPIPLRLTAAFIGELGRLDGCAIPAHVRHEVQRTLLNCLGTTVGASHNAAVEIVLRHQADHGGRPVAPVPGRHERADLHHAALATGIAAHVDDFDDTHLQTVIHPGAPVIAAALPLGFVRGVSGSTLLRAVALGCEAELRIGAAISPWHYDAGWHITGTVGVLGAAFAASVVLGLDEERTATALGIAASSTVGMREAFGTMTKSFHIGRAAANGILAATLSEQGLSGPADVLEKRSGYLAVLTPMCAPERIIDRIGEHWEVLANTYKPYPCGIVCHPAIDAARALHTRADPADVEEVVVRCHPLVVELTGNPDPHDGLEARFSTIHGVAIGLLDGRAGLHEYSDERVGAADAVGMRARITLQVDDSLARDSAVVSAQLRDGQTVVEIVEHARGSRARPMSDEDLAEKVRDLVEPVLPQGTTAVIAAVSALEGAPDLQALAAALTPERPG